MSQSPTSRSLRVLRKRGMTAEVVQRFNPGARCYHDLFGFIDIVALEPGGVGLWAIQTTTVSNQAARLKKIEQEPKAALWRACGNRIVVHGWAKKGPRGGRKLWTLTETEVSAPAAAASGASAPEDGARRGR